MPRSPRPTGDTAQQANRALLAVDDALAQILYELKPVDPETVDMQSAVGRILRQEVTAQLTLPAHDTSSMDGYAVRMADLETIPHILTRVGESAAGHPWTGTIGANQAVRIFTGAYLPDGADCVVLQEDCDADEEADGATITVKEAPKLGQFIRPAGLDVAQGDTLLAAGTKMTARGIALAIATGHTSLSVARRPIIGILSTGDELAEPGTEMFDGQIISSNADYLAAFVRACGGEPVQLGIAADVAGAALAKIRNSPLPLDFVVTTGGASVGVHDHIRDDLRAAGSRLNFWKIAMRPGKPLISGSVDGVPMLGLPGNPVSSAVCALVFLQPAIQKLSGGTARPLMITTELGTALPANDKRQDYLRTRLQHRDNALPLSTPAKRQDSSMISVLTHADGLMIRPPFDPPKDIGDHMPVMLFPDLV